MGVNQDSKLLTAQEHHHVHSSPSLNKQEEICQSCTHFRGCKLNQLEQAGRLLVLYLLENAVTETIVVA